MIRQVLAFSGLFLSSLWLSPLLLAQSVPVADPAPAAEPANAQEVEDNIVITGRREEQTPMEIMLDFVNEIGDPVGSSFGFARMEKDLCVKAHNVAPEVGDYFVNRMSALAVQLGMQKQAADCKPNVDIIFTSDGPRMAASLRDREPSLLRPLGTADGTTQGRAALTEFVESDAAVRWWQVTVPVDYGGDIAVKLPGQPAPYVAASNSRLSSGVRNNLLGTIVIIDVERMGEFTWDQVTDYVSMVALAQVDPHVSLAGYDSILNLFSGARTAPQLTEWDKAYLHALYTINLHMLPGSQKGQLANELLRTLEDAD